MRRHFRIAAWPVGTIVTALAFAFWFGVAAPQSAAAAAAPPAADVAATAVTQPPQLVHAPLFAGFIDRFLGFFEGNLGNQRRMLQFGLVMMLLGLWIIWWRKS